MTDIKVNSLIQKLEKYKVRVSKSKQKSKEFLVEAGVVTPKGNLKNNFKHLCIPQEQG
ncbi:MAG: hypothetical protein ACHQHN_19080 [Sphingobacteriales bacterium]